MGKFLEFSKYWLKYSSVRFFPIELTQFELEGEWSVERLGHTHLHLLFIFYIWM